MKNRPLTPHLIIYKPQITSIISIFHRITGSILIISIVGLIFLFYLDLAFSEFFLIYKQNLIFEIYFYWLILSLNAFIFIAFCFHLTNGIRHIIFDLAIGLDNKNILITGFVILIITIFASILILL